MTVELQKILIIDDSEDYRNLLVRKFGRLFPETSIDEIDPLNNEMPGKDYTWTGIDLLILDYHLGIEETGLDWFKKFNTDEMPATILLTARGSEEVAVNAIKIGVDNYLVKEKLENEKFINLIDEIVTNKREKRKKLLTLSGQASAFNKASFFRKLESVTKDKNIRTHILLISPESYRKVGKDKGIIQQDRYIKYVADFIYNYMNEKKIPSNFVIYRDEYIAAICEDENIQDDINNICTKLENEKFTVNAKKYPCNINMGAIDIKLLEGKELEKSDYELLTLAMKLCEVSKSNKNKNIVYYGELDLHKLQSFDIGQEIPEVSEEFDIEAAITDGRIVANYQPWVYVLSDDTETLKSIYDVRIELMDVNGNAITQQGLLKLLEDPFSKRVIDKWVLRNTAFQLVNLNKKNRKDNTIKLAVKITLGSISDSEFLFWLKDLFRESKLPGNSLLFEVDANEFIKDPEKFKTLIKLVGKKYDVKFILSNIAQVDVYYQVKDIQIFDFVKLNIKNLTFGLHRAPLQDLLEHIKKDGAMVVAVNVTDAESLALATEFNIDYVHGYLIGKPHIDVISDSEGDLYCVI